MASDEALTCEQIVFAEDDCCRDEICGDPAEWRHTESGATLCGRHEANARRWSSGGVWKVGTRDVSYPDGWVHVDVPAAAGAPRLERVESGSGFVIEREGLDL
jgi:hypothetical protein